MAAVSNGEEAGKDPNLTLYTGIEPQHRSQALRCFCFGQSVKIPSFGAWRWIAAEGTTGTEGHKLSSLRPTFQLSDSFCKKYCVVNKGCDTSRRPGTKVKEINVYEVFSMHFLPPYASIPRKRLTTDSNHLVICLPHSW